MGEKVILISIDGMRPDGLRQCGNPFLQEMEKRCAYTYTGHTVYPSVTLPCHMSMFHSVCPERHGIVTNDYAPMVRPVKGIFEKCSGADQICAMYYGWEPLRNIAEPGSLKFSRYINAYMEESSDTMLTDAAMADISRYHPDFVFLYMVETDEKGGHDNGWMSEAYLQRISTGISNVQRVMEAFGDDYSIILTADHGGHDRAHGTDMPEDMTIPLFFYGKDFTPGQHLENVSILDIAPTIMHIFGMKPEREWEGKSLI